MWVAGSDEYPQYMHRKKEQSKLNDYNFNASMPDGSKSTNDDNDTIKQQFNISPTTE